MSEINYRSLKSTIEKSDCSAQDEKTNMYIRLYCQGTVALTCDGILGKYHATPEELAEVYENSLPEPLKEYCIDYERISANFLIMRKQTNIVN